MNLTALLLAPLSLLYGMGVAVRNLFYDRAWVKPVEFDIPLIGIGNLTVGGSGKTPHTEYLINYLSEHLKIAVLSRGYRRKSNGFQIASPQSNWEHIGDEPLQIYRKFPGTLVAVSESRALAIPQLVSMAPGLNLILLDDAFQHRAVKPGLNILLTEYDKPYTRDWLLPSGRLREGRNGAKRADIIVVTKCPKDISEEQKQKLIRELSPSAQQKVFFSYVEYGQPYHINDFRDRLFLDKEMDVILLCGIAKPETLKEDLQEWVGKVYMKDFLDHHPFDDMDMRLVEEQFKDISNKKKIILTTEKDMQRLERYRPWIKKQELPVYVLPMRVAFAQDEERKFKKAVASYINSYHPENKQLDERPGQEIE